MSLPHGFKRIVLNLARSKEHPNGSARHGYEIIAPLDARDHLDVAAWKEHRDACRVHRFWGDERDDAGHLVHRAGGAKGSTWIFDYDGSSTDDDEAGYRLADHAFTVGEYVSVRDEDGEMHTFIVASVQAAGR